MSSSPVAAASRARTASGLVEELAKELGGVVGRHESRRRLGLDPVRAPDRPDRQTVSRRCTRPRGGSGAIQHKVGMQTAETIVAINRDPDAPYRRVRRPRRRRRPLRGRARAGRRESAPAAAAADARPPSRAGDAMEPRSSSRWRCSWPWPPCSCWSSSVRHSSWLAHGSTSGSSVPSPSSTSVSG